MQNNGNYEIRYEIVAEAQEFSLFGWNLKASHPIYFVERFDVHQELLKKSSCSLSTQIDYLIGGTLGFKAEIDEDVVLIGSQVPIRLLIINQSWNHVMEVHVSLMEERSSKQVKLKTDRKKIEMVVVPCNVAPKSRHSMAITYTIPATVQPSNRFGKIVECGYLLKIALHTSSNISKTPHVWLPIVLINELK